MDCLAILEGRLGLIGRFYSTAAEPFVTTMRRIESSEEPFVPRYPPGDYDGYEYQAEYNEAHDCLGLLGSCGLGLLVKAFHDYLRAFVDREGASQERKGSWFDWHCRFLEEKTPFRWPNSPVPRDQLEQIILGRNDAWHDPMIDRSRPRQTADHFRKYPVSRFAPGWEIAAISGEEGKPQFPLTIDITPTALSAAIADVVHFCTFVEAQRTKW